MYVIKPYESAVTLFSTDGHVRTFASKKEALNALGYRWIKWNVGRHFGSVSHKELTYKREPGTDRRVLRFYEVYNTPHNILRDESGRPLVAEDFDGIREERKKWSRYDYLRNWNGEGSVPGIGRPRNGHYYRRIQTLHARSQSQCLDEFDIAPRARRNATNIPNNYDDIRIAAREIRNWKKYRKTRWKQS